MKGCQEEKTFKKGTAHTTMYTQGLGQPRMNSEERVLDMMAQLDEHSEKIPEGMYLQFCDHLKFFYQNVQNKKKRLAAETERRSQLAQLAAETERRLRLAQLAAETERRLRLATARQAIQVEEQRDEEQEVALFARPPGPRRCGCCRQLGHNRRTCPQRVQ